MKKGSVFVLIVLMVSLLSTGCKDTKERNIIGVWELVPFTETTATTKWSFFDGNVVYISQNDIYTDSADYAITSNVVEYFVEISGFCPDPDSVTYPGFHISSCFDGKYKIDLMKSDLLKLQRVSNGDGSTGAAFLYLEFTKGQ